MATTLTRLRPPHKVPNELMVVHPTILVLQHSGPDVADSIITALDTKTVQGGEQGSS